MERAQREANRLNNMTGLTEEARKAISETPLNMLEEFWGGFKSAEEINSFVEEMKGDRYE